jgi:PAS domain-containing protein
VGSTAPDPISTGDVELREHLARTATRPAVAPAPAPAPAAASRRRGGKAAAKAPEPVAATAGRRTRSPAQETLQAQHQLTSSRIAASNTFDEVADAIGATTSGWPVPDVVVLLLLEPDGAFRFVGSHGLPVSENTEWLRIPPHADIPIAIAARDRTPLLIMDRETLSARFPMMTSRRYDAQAMFAAPLIHEDRVVGSLGLAWKEPLDLDEDTQRYLVALAQPVARRVAELSSAPGAAALGWLGDTGDAAVTWLPILLENAPDPTLLLSPVHDGDRVIDFALAYANAAAADLIKLNRFGGDETLLGMYPLLGAETLLPRLAALLHDGGQVRIDAAPVDPAATPSAAAPAQVMTARASRLWDRVVLTFRIHSEAERITPQLLDAERIGRVGSFAWELSQPRPYCSPQLYRLYHGDGDTRPLTVAGLLGCVHEDDVPAVRDAATRALAGEERTWEFRGARHLAGRHLRIVAGPVRDSTGTVTAVRGTVQDITEERAIETRLRLAEEALAAQRRRLDAELRAAQSLQRALLPTEGDSGVTAGLSVSGHSRVSADAGRVHGDWYDTCALPGKASLLVIGDVAGSGLAAMSAAARLRYAVRAYAALDMSPAEILGSVNTMLCSLEPERTATLVVARYEPRERRLHWAVAGQAQPVRYRRDGHAELLTGPLGLPVGAAPQVSYEDATVDLAEGDRVLLYTDGLVGGRGTDLVDALEVLLGAGAHANRDDVKALAGYVRDALQTGPDADMGAMLVRVDS